MPHSPFAAAFTPGTRFKQDNGDIVAVSNQVVGQLRVPSGRIVVVDPFITDFADPGPPLARTAPTGTFPVELSLARFANDDVRVACARVKFADAPAVRFEPAGFEGSPEPVKEGDEEGYGVDAGMGCFFDAAGRGDVDESVSEAWLDATEKNSVNTWTSYVAELGGANVVMFSSGWGDGFYRSYWGLDEGGTVVELITDFDVLTEAATEQLELPLPLSRGSLAAPFFAQHRLKPRTPWLSRSSLIVGGDIAGVIVKLSTGEPVEMKHKDGERRWSWSTTNPAAKLVVRVITGSKILEPLPGV